MQVFGDTEIFEENTFQGSHSDLETWKNLETWENLEKATFFVQNLENGVYTNFSRVAEKCKYSEVIKIRFS